MKSKILLTGLFVILLIMQASSEFIQDENGQYFFYEGDVPQTFSIFKPLVGYFGEICTNDEQCRNMESEFCKPKGLCGPPPQFRDLTVCEKGVCHFRCYNCERYNMGISCNRDSDCSNVKECAYCATKASKCVNGQCTTDVKCGSRSECGNACDVDYDCKKECDAMADGAHTYDPKCSNGDCVCIEKPNDDIDAPTCSDTSDCLEPAKTYCQRKGLKPSEVNCKRNLGLSCGVCSSNDAGCWWKCDGVTKTPNDVEPNEYYEPEVNDCYTSGDFCILESCAQDCCSGTYYQSEFGYRCGHRDDSEVPNTEGLIVDPIEVEKEKEYEKNPDPTVIKDYQPAVLPQVYVGNNDIVPVVIILILITIIGMVFMKTR